VKLLCIGDIVGKPGREAVRHFLPKLIESRHIDFVLANAENIAHGKGASLRLLDELRDYGVHLFTMGNHTWRRPEFVNAINQCPYVARPANYTKHAPGQGTALYRFADGRQVAAINLQGRVFMEPTDCPFAAVDRELEALPESVTIKIVDVHAEATSEKAALAWYLDGKCTAVVGTHTHVQTADERLLFKHTAFISDIGMCGPYNSILGVQKEMIIDKLVTGLPKKWELAGGPVQFNAVLVDADPQTGKAKSIERIREVEDL